ncbi:glycosyltransferase involved in cell wall biosynthesis [Neolewinella xylanilytica]|uniref:Glycosyltransferase involved in cell wall biosynthesis n=1 Tax=Neolewinella xylanilytica TaxID=1514080 RepID=A0A2S6I4V3_9BACT|nr:glycosyltransferase family 4 protein [Neolewinella xylanilytica]PPK86139.1 glycosyltransferase involved in cell wall biosynthesis [Neolewinella xylanilytica]
MKIALLGNYPPKACGIGTFTHSLALAILSNLKAGEVSEFAEIIAMEDPADDHQYPEEVSRCIPPQLIQDYRDTADYLNENDFDLLLLQHEYGIFGGDDGAYILHLLDRVRIPVIVTFHTVLKEPSYGQRSVLRRIGRRAQSIVVMSQLARELLRDVFRIEEEKIDVIEHGVPVIESDPIDLIRQRHGWQDRRVLFTFGLLGRGKGIETSIRALPAIVARHPNTLYVVLGKTHPHVLRSNGEEYRNYLQELASELGVADNLRMISKFADEQELFDCLRAADVYVVPYPNEAQITSGTLAYAVGAGAAIVSTPFWHATELLQGGRGKLFPFNDSAALADQILELLDNETERSAMRERAATYGEHLLWPRIGKQYLRVFGKAKVAYARFRQETAVTVSLPQLKLDHLLRLTDDCGILQHAKYATPNRHEGYCLDDNGRALLLTGMLLRKGLGDREALLKLADTYIAYVYHAQNQDGTFRNFMSFDRRFLDKLGSEDSYGRALWGVSYCYANPPRPDQRQLLEEIFIRAIGHLESMRSPRTLAYGIISLTYFLDHKPGDEAMLDLLDRSCNRLVDHYQDSRTDQWHWFENYLTYSNGILPMALFRALRHLNKDRLRVVAAEATDFLVAESITDGVLYPVGCHEPYIQDCDRPRFDQQPVDAMAMVLLLSEACMHPETRHHGKNLKTAFAWFTGQNEMMASMYNPQSGGCYDGLMEAGVNYNQGAESLLAYLISRVEMDNYCRKDPAEPCYEGDEDTDSALKKLLNGFALPEQLASLAEEVKKITAG